MNSTLIIGTDDFVEIKEKAYQQGKADERKEWERALAELLIKYSGDIYEALPDVVKEIKNESRAEVIEELLEIAKENYDYDFMYDLIPLVECLNEEKND